MTTLRDRLTDLAGDAPSGAPAPGLWEAGVRRQRRRRAGAVVALVATVAVIAGVGAFMGSQERADRAPLPAGVPFDRQHLPRTVYPPSEWEQGTDEAGPPGPLAAVSVAMRSRAEGLTATSRAPAAFGVSAVDGSERFLDLAGTDTGRLGEGTLTLSPDGTKVGYNRYDGSTLVGWAVYDTITGTTVVLEDPAQPEIRGTDVFEIEFSGDSRYLQTNYSRTGSDGSRDDQLVVWDAETGDAVPAEGTGHFWLPSLGSGPSGIVWSRGGRTFTFDPASGRRSTVEVPQEVIEWSSAPAGDASAYIAFGDKERDPWRLFSGDGRELDLDGDIDDLYGWRNQEVVVVATLPDHGIRYVNLRTGAVRTDRMAVEDDGDDFLMWPSYAADLWANDLVDGVHASDAEDPRLGVRELVGWLAAAGVIAVGVGWLVRRRRVRA